jgi:hypothetical protein
MKNIDYIENKIELEELYIVKVKDYIKKMFSSKNQSKNILPYNIHVNDVFDMLQDVVTIENDDDYLVFFNYEFVLCLLHLGVTPNRITYIANHNDSYLLTRDGMAGRSGMRTILFDKTIYEKYSYRKQWKEYIMNKLNGKKDFIAVGNIPFTINSTDSSNSKKIGNDFIKLMNEFKKACYILPAKFDSKTFKEDLILNPKLKKIVYHKKSLFDIAKNYYTCHIVTTEIDSNEFIFEDNISKSIILKKDINLQLSREIDDTFILNSSKKTLGSLWIRGNEHDGALKTKGKYKVVSKVGRDDANFIVHKYSNTETTGFGKWKVVMANVSSGWVAKLVPPDFSICYSIIAFSFDNKKNAECVRDFIMNPTKREFFRQLRSSDANTKTLFDKIELPDGII